MKELSTEEKAQAYNEALERAKKLYEQGTITESLSYVFPELKESEDDRIRKELIALLKENHETGKADETWSLSGIERWIAWLSADKVEPKFKVGDYIERKDGLGSHAKIIVVGVNVYGCEKLIHSEDESPFFDLMFKNQDEFQISSDFKQNPTDKVEPKFKVKYAGSEYNVLEVKDIAGVTYYGIEDEPNHIDYVLPNNCEIVSEQKIVDKVEPKFHEGEWVVHHGTENIYQVVAVIDNQYQLKYGDTYTVQKCADVDRCARLWDITKDAKKGDILSDGTTVFIFKDLLSDGSVMSYCDCDTNSGESDAFCPFSLNLMCQKITPATKEQCDTLMKAMFDAGYSFDFDKKKLKKLGSIDEYEGLTDFERTLADICIGWIGKEIGWKEYIKDNSDTLLKIAVEKFNSVQDAPFEQKPTDEEMKEALHTEYEKGRADAIGEMQKHAWSEDDEKTRNRIISALNHLIEVENVIGFELLDSDISWLKSLKYRVQPKQEWNEEDEHRVKDTIYFLDTAKKHYASTVELDACIDWLKSLRPQLMT